MVENRTMKQNNLIDDSDEDSENDASFDELHQ